MISDKVSEAFESNKDAFGDIGHGYTYSGHPVGAAAALATLQQIKANNLADNAAARGTELMAGLQTLSAKYDCVGDLRGHGLMIALELVDNPETKIAVSKDKMNRLLHTVFQEGVMVRTSGNNVILSPPLIINTQHVNKIISALDIGLEALK